MTTYRVVKRARYAQIDQRTIRDSRLSFRARGLLTFLLDKPDDWRFTSEALASEAPEGRDAIRAALRELATCGYMVQEKVQGERGRWVTVTSVHEVPPGPEIPSSVEGSPGPGNPTLGEPGPIRKPETKEQSSKTSSSPPRKRDEIWDALEEVAGPVSTQMETARRGKCVKQLKEVGASARDVRERAQEMQRRWPRVTLTDTGLVGRWSSVEPGRDPNAQHRSNDGVIYT